MAFDVGNAIRMARAMQEKLDTMQAEFDAKTQPLEDFIAARRNEIHQFLNQTNQKSAKTEYGLAYWKPKITYRVEDKDAFRRHVIGAEAWHLITWASAPANCETFTEEHKMPPPGLVRSAVNILYINPPEKPRKKKIVDATGGQAQAPTTEEPDAPEQQEAAE